MRIIDDETAELSEGDCQVVALDRVNWHGTYAARGVTRLELDLTCDRLLETGHRRLPDKDYDRIMHLINGAQRVYVLPRD